MIIKQLTLATLDTGTLDFGFVGENEHIGFSIKCDSVFDEYPTATASLLIKAPDNTIYPKTVEVEGYNVGWVITASDTAYPGSGQIQLTFTEDGAVVKTVIANTNVKDSLVGDDPPPDPIADWISNANQILNKVDGMTATAESLPSGDDPSVTVETVNGHYNLEFGIPAGDPGDPTEIIDDNAGVGDTTKVWSADKSSGVASVLLSDIDRKAPVILRDASGDIVTITDGADNMPLSACTVQVNPVQEGSGDPSPENIRPITGVTASNIFRTGKNLFGGDVLATAILDSCTSSASRTGDIVTLPNGSTNVNPGTANRVKMLENKFEPGQYTIIIKQDSTEKTKSLFTVYYTDGTSVIISASHYNTTGNYWRIVTSESKTVQFVRMNRDETGEHTYDVSQSGIFKGDVAFADFVPYQGQTYPITFPTEAGTVYGGTVDLKAKTLTVDRAMATFSNADGWTYTAGGFYHDNVFGFNTATLSAGGTGFLCNRYREASYVSSSANVESRPDNTFFNQNTSLSNHCDRCWIKDTALTSIEAFGASLQANPLVLVYPLDVPLTYSLTDLPTIITLPGYNAIWSDAGAIAVTYPADTKSYVDDHTPVQDVQINGTSIIQDGVANVPVATDSTLGAVKIFGPNGILIDSNQQLAINYPSSSQIKNGTAYYRPIVPALQHESAFYALAKAAGADMASSSNPVGTYTDAAKAAIQKMLGVYQAPWELIREDTVTNSTEADIDITVDGNGQSFELTDAVLFTVFPSQATGAKAGDYGRTYFYNGSTVVTVTYLGAVNISANASAYGGISKVVNHGGMIETSYIEYGTMATHGNLRATLLSGEGTPFIISSATIDKIVIRKITGTANYKLYGRRKWN